MYSPIPFKINIQPIAEKLGIDSLNLRASAAALNPVTKDLYILASENKLLVVLDRKGNFKDVYRLDPGLFKQPEGLTFTPFGDMLISNESGKEGSANILIYKYQK